MVDVVEILKGITPLVDQLYTTPEEKAEAQFKLLELAQKSEIAQLEVNKAEASNPSLFVSGWRPAVGWTCVGALVLTFIIIPLVTSFVVYYTAFTGEHVDLSGLPEIDMMTLMPILGSLLGIGGYRTYEKLKGVART